MAEQYRCKDCKSMDVKVCYPVYLDVNEICFREAIEANQDDVDWESTPLSAYCESCESNSIELLPESGEWEDLITRW